MSLPEKVGTLNCNVPKLSFLVNICFIEILGFKKIHGVIISWLMNRSKKRR
jgi:hypothetical protein